MKNFFCVYGDVITLKCYQCETTAEADEIAKAAPSSFDIPIGTEITVIQIPDYAYAKLNTILDRVEETPSLLSCFKYGLRGMLEAVKDGSATSSGICSAMDAIWILVDVNHEYGLPMVFTEDVLVRTLSKLKSARSKTSHKIKRSFMDQMIKEYSRKLELVQKVDSSVIFV